MKKANICYIRISTATTIEHFVGQLWPTFAKNEHVHIVAVSQNCLFYSSCYVFRAFIPTVKPCGDRQNQTPVESVCLPVCLSTYIWIFCIDAFCTSDNKMCLKWLLLHCFGSEENKQTLACLPFPLFVLQQLYHVFHYSSIRDKTSWRILNSIKDIVNV